MNTAYQQLISRKSQHNTGSGFEPIFMPDFLFDFQKLLIEWGIRQGRFAFLLDCGLGKGPLELVFAENVVRHTNMPVLIGCPLAVAAQLIREGEKFGIEVERSRDGNHKPGARIIVTNYDRLHYFDRHKYAAFIGDESSILKNFSGEMRTQITEFMREMPYRMLSTATAAPNDHTEIGTHSEALGYLGFIDMLNRFFKNDNNNSAVGRAYGEVVRWRFKGHAEMPFFRWLVSWARGGRKPSDFGFDDGKFILPPCEERLHVIDADKRDGMLFALPAVGIREQREERKVTLNQRCEKLAELVLAHPHQSVAWCQLDDEGDLVEKLIPGCVQVHGSMSDEAKEEAFLNFSLGKIKKLVSKYRMGGWGMNWQNCHHMATFPTHSFEQMYQGKHRFLRFGQKHKVICDIVMTEGDRATFDNMKRKERQSDTMFTRLVELMNDALHINRGSDFSKEQIIPSWL